MIKRYCDWVLKKLISECRQCEDSAGKIRKKMKVSMKWSAIFGKKLKKFGTNTTVNQIEEKNNYF